MKVLKLNVEPILTKISNKAQTAQLQIETPHSSGLTDKGVHP